MTGPARLVHRSDQFPPCLSLARARHFSPPLGPANETKPLPPPVAWLIGMGARRIGLAPRSAARQTHVSHGVNQCRVHLSPQLAHQSPFPRARDSRARPMLRNIEDEPQAAAPDASLLSPTDVQQLVDNVYAILHGMSANAHHKRAMVFLLLRGVSPDCRAHFSNALSGSGIPLGTLERYARDTAEQRTRAHVLLTQAYPKGVRRQRDMDAATVAATEWIHKECGYTNSGRCTRLLRWDTREHLFREYTEQVDPSVPKLGRDRFIRLTKELHVRRAKNSPSDQYACVVCRVLEERLATIEAGLLALDDMALESKTTEQKQETWRQELLQAKAA